MRTLSNSIQTNDGVILKIAALFVESDGCYSNNPCFDIWDINRDARLYNGPHPVIAHPPCQLWGNLAFVNYKRWGGEHNRPGNDGGCFKSALTSVRNFGGVLEHPKNSRAWTEYGITKPTNMGWCQISDKEFVCEVWQSAYGHRANKATWLYYVGRNKPLEMKWEKLKGFCQIGFHDQRGKKRNKPTLSKREANATPWLFRNALYSLALNSNIKI